MSLSQLNEDQYLIQFLNSVKTVLKTIIQDLYLVYLKMEALTWKKHNLTKAREA